MVLERRAPGRRQRRGLAVQVAHEAALAVVAHAVAQDEIVHAPADVDRVDLDVAVMSERCGYARKGLIEAEGAPQKSASHGRARREGQAARPD
jgi:hypothetical protein